MALIADDLSAGKPVQALAALYHFALNPPRPLGELVPELIARLSRGIRVGYRRLT